MKAQTDVVLIVWNQDIIDLISTVLLNRNLDTVGIQPIEELKAMRDLIGDFHPDVVVFDLTPPYKPSSDIAAHLVCCFPEQAFVFTCADPRLAYTAAPWLCHHPVFQKPYEVSSFTETLVSKVRRAS